MVPVIIETPKSSILTPAIMRRNISREIMKNNGNIRNYNDKIVRHQEELYVIKAENPKSIKLASINEDIEKLKIKIFHLETHNMILELHLETAAPGQYPNQKIYKSSKSRNFGRSITKTSSCNSSKLNYGYLTTENSSNFLSTKPSGLTEGEWLYRTPLVSIADEEDDKVSF